MFPTRVSQTDQYNPTELAQRQFDTVLNRLFGGREVETNGYAAYGVDVQEDADHLYISAELPGFAKEDVNITLDDSVLTFTAQRKEETPQENGAKRQWVLRERRFNRVQRSFTLTPAINPQSVKAALADGVLTITLDKREETKPRKITVA